MAWGKKLSPAAKKFLIQTAKDFRIGSIDWLPACIAFETIETFSPSIRPRRRDGSLISSAVGLIQFMKATAADIGVDYDKLPQMSVEEQLKWVWVYFRKTMKDVGVRSLDTVEDVYMVIHWPQAVGKPLTQTMYTDGSLAYKANRGLDLDKNGTITKAEAGSLIRAKLAKGLQPEYFG